jgi:coatomer subunit beta
MYWEIIEKKNPQTGHLLSEMILICNALKNNLTHPNEYIRGSTLRFLCKIKESEILESLISSVTENLTHRHSYVRKNAVWAVYSIWTVNNELIPDAAELIETFLYAESNLHAKRNAFLVLFWVDKERAIHYLNTNLANVPAAGDAFQLVLLENVRRICRTHAELKGNFIRTIFSLVNSSSPAVSYEGANTLISLSHAPTAIRAAVTAYKNLLNAQSDNNVKLIILDRVIRIKKLNEKIVEENLMDIMRNLSTPNEDLRKKILGLALDLLNSNNVNEIVKTLKTQLASTESQ